MMGLVKNKNRTSTKYSSAVLERRRVRGWLQKPNPCPTLGDSILPNLAVSGGSILLRQDSADGRIEIARDWRMLGVTAIERGTLFPFSNSLKQSQYEFHEVIRSIGVRPLSLSFSCTPSTYHSSTSNQNLARRDQGK